MAFRALRTLREVVEHRLPGDERQLAVSQQRQLLVADVRGGHPLTRSTTAARAAESRDRTVPSGTSCTRAISS